MSVISLVVLLSLVVYRTTRFLIDDSLIDEPRWWLEDKIKGKWSSIDMPGWRAKLVELMGCPYCVSAYVAAGATALTDLYTSVPLPVWVWLASMGGAMIVWRFVETLHE